MARLLPHHHRVAVAGIAVVACLDACGGGSTKPAATSGDHSTNGSSSAGDEGSKTSDEPENQGPDCSDGTCFACGKGMCPAGFYCDQTAAGGPACSWLPECASKSSCACVERGLGTGCSCDARDGGLYVSCK